MCHCCHWEYNVCLASNEFVLPYEIRMWECPSPLSKILNKYYEMFKKIPFIVMNEKL